MPQTNKGQKRGEEIKGWENHKTNYSIGKPPFSSIVSSIFPINRIVCDNAPISFDILRESANLRATENLKTPDAILQPETRNLRPRVKATVSSIKAIVADGSFPIRSALPKLFNNPCDGLIKVEKKLSIDKMRV